MQAAVCNNRELSCLYLVRQVQNLSFYLPLTLKFSRNLNILGKGPFTNDINQERAGGCPLRMDKVKLFYRKIEEL